jgi:hypothetical protein
MGAFCLGARLPFDPRMLNREWPWCWPFHHSNPTQRQIQRPTIKLAIIAVITAAIHSNLSNANNP